MYYLSSRYYDPEVGRFISSDSIIDIRGVNTINLYAYCGNNPVNYSDPSGHLFLGTIVGGIVGGIFGGLGALVSGKSVKAGIVSGAMTGAIIGFLGDNVISGGSTTAVAAGILYAGAAIIGNITNQYLNYRIETRNENIKSENAYVLAKNNSSKNNEKVYAGVEYSNFEDYIDYRSVAVSALSSGLFAPISMGAGYLVDSAFQGASGGLTQTVAKAISTTMFEINTSSLQMVAEGIIEIFFE